MDRRAIPPIAWLLSAGTAVALVILVIPTLAAHGTRSFFLEGDASFYRATALSPFGTGRAFVQAGFASEIPYRYGRIGLPLLAWLSALGRPDLIPWTLIVVHLAAIAAIPGLAADLLDAYGARPVVGAVVLVSPLLFIRNIVYAEPLLIAVILLAYILEARGHTRGALVAFACAMLVKEIAIVALIPWVWSAMKERNLRKVAAYLSTFVPYAAWCVWLRIRVGEYPFFAKTLSRRQAVAWPGVAIHDVLAKRTPGHVAVVSLVLATFALCCVGAYLARRWPLGGCTAAFAVLTVCLGPNALRFSEETLRLLAVPMVFGLLCVALRVDTWAQLRWNRAFAEGR